MTGPPDSSGSFRHWGENSEFRHRPGQGQRPLTQGTIVSQEDVDLWRQRKVEEAWAEQADPPDPWPTRVPGSRALVAVTLVILTAVLAVAALPQLIFGYSGNSRYHPTTLQLPAEIEGFPRTAEDEITAEDRQSASRLLAAVQVPLETMVGVYGRPTGIRITVAAGRPAEPIPGVDLASIRDGFLNGVTAAGGQLREIDSGDLGGWFGCAQLERRQTLCLALNTTALISISLTSKNPSTILLAEAARNAIEHPA